MSKDATAINIPISRTDDTMNTSLDQFSTFLYAPVRKLDADEYTANDLDGVTESATGSGNLNFLMMQAGQTNEAMGNLNPFNISSGDNPHFNAMNGGNDGAGALPSTQNGFDTAMDRPFDGGNGFDGQSDLNSLGNNSSNAGSLGASNLAANTATLNPFSDARSFTASSSSDTTNTTPPDSPTNGINGSSGSDGTNGTDGTDGTGTTIINIDDTVTNLGDVINNTTTNLGDVINNTTTNLFDTVNNATTNIFDTVNNATTNIFDTINNTTNNVTNIVNNIFDGDGLGPIGLDLDVVLDDLLDLNLDGILGDTVTNIIHETIDLSPVLNPVEALVGNLLSSTSLNILLNPFQPDNSANDYDLHVGTDLELLGLQIPDLAIDVPLDIVEVLVGDLDIGLELTNDLLGGVPVVGDVLDGILGGGSGNGDTDLALGGLGGLLDADVTNGIVETILNPVENLIGDTDIGGAIGIDLLGLGSGQSGPDSDISIPLDLALIDDTILGDTLDISLDPLENIIGDMDLDLGVAGNLLGDVAGGMFDNIAGGNGENDLLNQIGDGLSDVIGDLIPVGGDADTDLSLGTGIDILDTGLIDNGLGVVLNPVEDLAGDIDIGGAIGLDLLGTANTGGADTDISIPLDLDFIDSPLLDDSIDINLDPIEDLAGDIDLDLGVGGNILGDLAPSLFDNAEGGSGDGSLLAHIGDGLSDLGDAVLAPIVDPLAPSLDETLGNLDSLLDSLTSTIDPILDTAIGLLDSCTPSTCGLDLGALTGGLGSGDPVSSLTTWTETILPGAGDLLGGGLLADPVSIIPDPILTAPVLSLPAIPVIPVAPALGGGLLGGLGGHHGHGGLFG